MAKHKTHEFHVELSKIIWAETPEEAAKILVASLYEPAVVLVQDMNSGEKCAVSTEDYCQTDITHND